MDREWSDTNRESMDQLEALFTRKKTSGNARIIVFAGAAISKHAPACLPAADPMLKAMIRVLLCDPGLSKSFQQANLLFRLYRFICRSCASTGRVIPPEMVYDSIYEYAGNKVFNALECLKSKSPNLNHRILAALLERGFIDSIVTTNFDSLIEQCLLEVSKGAFLSKKMHVWKIHGDIRTPPTMVTTMRRVGQTAFDEDLVDELRKLLDGSHVIFVGYSGMDPDLMPAFKTAKMDSVYWCVYDPEELKSGNKNRIIDRDPCRTIQEKGTSIWWVIGDLQKELLARIAESVLDEQMKSSISRMSSGQVTDCRMLPSPLKLNINRWEHHFFQRLSPVQKVRAILHILYSIALYSPESEKALILLIETADAIEKDPALSKYLNSELKRDLHGFQAEAYLKLAELVKHIGNRVIAESMSDSEFRHRLVIFKRVALLKQSVQLDVLIKKMNQPPLKINSSNTGEIIHQLFVRAKDQLTPILPLPFRDGVQVQALLNASTILWYLAGSMTDEKALRNLHGAEKMLEEGLKILDHARMDPGKRNLLKARCYSNLAILSAGHGNAQTVLRNFETAESLFKHSGDLYSYAGVCINAGLFLMNVYRSTKINMYKDEAANYYQKARSTLDSFPNDSLAEAAAELGRGLSREV